MSNYDYKSGHDKPNPMSRDESAAMPQSDRANFFRLGGTLFDAAKSTDAVSKATEIIVGPGGRTITRGAFDALTQQQKFDFCLVRNL